MLFWEISENLGPSAEARRSLFLKSTPKRPTTLDDSFPQELRHTPENQKYGGADKRPHDKSSLASPETVTTGRFISIYLLVAYF